MKLRLSIANGKRVLLFYFFAVVTGNTLIAQTGQCELTGNTLIETKRPGRTNDLSPGFITNNAKAYHFPTLIT